MKGIGCYLRGIVHQAFRKGLVRGKAILCGSCSLMFFERYHKGAMRLQGKKFLGG